MATTPNLGLVLTPDGNTSWGNDQRNNLSKIDAFAGSGNTGVATGSKRLFVDGSRTDTYTQTGDVNTPFKTIMAAVNKVIANGDSIGSNPAYLILIAPGVYSETITLSSSSLGNLSFSSMMPDDTQINTVTVNGPGGNGVCLVGTTATSMSVSFYGINFFNSGTPNGNTITDSSGNGTFEIIFIRCFIQGGATNAFVFNNAPAVFLNSGLNGNFLFNGANQWFNMKGGKAFGGSITLSTVGCYAIIEQGCDFGPGTTFTIANGIQFYLYSGSRFSQGTTVIVQSGGLFVGRTSAVRGTLNIQAGGSATLDDCWVANYTNSGSITANGTLFSNVHNATVGYQVNGGAPLGQFLRGNGTDFVPSAILPGDTPTDAISVITYNAKGDGQQYLDGSLTSGSPVLTAASGHFAAGDVGKMFGALLPPAGEVYTAYTKNDPGNYLVITPTGVSATAIPEAATATLYKDFGAGFFTGNFTHQLDIKDAYVGPSGSTYAQYWMLSNSNTGAPVTGDIYVQINNNGSAPFLYLIEGGLVVSSGLPISDNTQYWLTVSLTGTTLTVNVYTNSLRTALLGSQTITLTGTMSWRYLYAFSNAGGIPTAAVTILSENLTLSFTPTIFTSTIVSFQSATQVTLAASAPVSGSNLTYAWGTDNTAPFNNAMQAAQSQSVDVVYVPCGNYLFSGPISIPNRVTLKGTVPGPFLPRWVVPTSVTTIPQLWPTNTTDTAFIKMFVRQNAVANGTNVITGLSDTTKLRLGQIVQVVNAGGTPGLTPNSGGAWITSIDSVSQIHVSQSASFSGACTLTGGVNDAGVEDLMIYHPLQVLDSATTPLVFPPAIQIVGANSYRVRRITTINAYVGIALGWGDVYTYGMFTGSGWIADVYLGTLSMAMATDHSADVNHTRGIHVWPLFDMYGPTQTTPHDYGTNLDPWVQANGTGLAYYRADQAQVVDAFIFGKNIAVLGTTSPDTNISPNNGYGNFTNLTLDTIKTGVTVNSAQGPWSINNIAASVASGVASGGHLLATANAVKLVAVGGNVTTNGWGGSALFQGAGSILIANFILGIGNDQSVNPSIDTNISRLGGGLIAIGGGTAGDTGGSIALGGPNTASQGAIRLSNNNGIWMRNGNNTADYRLMSIDSGNNVAIGSGGNSGTLALALNGANVLQWDTANQCFFQGAGTNLVSLLNINTATASVSQNSLTLRFVGSFWNGSGPGQDVWTIQNVVGNGTNGTTTLQFGHSGSVGVATIDFSLGIALSLHNNGAGRAPGGILLIDNDTSGNFAPGIYSTGNGASLITYGNGGVNNNASTFQYNAVCNSLSVGPGGVDPNRDWVSGCALSLINISAATSSVPQSSVIMAIAGQYWNGGGSVLDYWTIQNVIGSGTNGASTLTFTHTGSSGSATASLPAITTPGITLVSGGGITWPGAAVLFYDSTRGGLFWNNQTNSMMIGAYTLGWYSGGAGSSSLDLTLNRQAAGVLEIGNAVSASGGGLLCGSITVPAGTPSIIIGTSGNGIGSSGTNILSLYASGIDQVDITSGALTVSATTLHRWTGGAIGASVDSGLSRVSTHTLAINDGTSYLNTNGNLQLNQITKYNNEATVAPGIAYHRGATILKTETGTDNSVLSVTPAATPGVYRISIVILVTAQSSANLNWGTSWQASSGVAQNAAGNGIQPAGSSSMLTNFGNLGTYYGTQVIDTDGSATPIVVKVTLTTGTVAYTVSAFVERLG